MPLSGSVAAATAWHHASGTTIRVRIGAMRQLLSGTGMEIGLRVD